MGAAWRVGAIAGASFMLILGDGCAGPSRAERTREVRATVERLLTAWKHADGRTFCSLLTGAALEQDERTAHVLGPEVTCEQLRSARSPHLSAHEVRALARDRAKAARTLRVERVSVDGDRATVRIAVDSWKPPRRTVRNTLTLRRAGGVWKIVTLKGL